MKMGEGLGLTSMLTIVSSPSAPVLGGSLSLSPAHQQQQQQSILTHSQQLSGSPLTILPTTPGQQHLSVSASTTPSPSNLSSSSNHNNNNNNNYVSTQNMADYLAQLIKDKKQLAIFPNLFLHVERILDEEIARVRGNLFHLSGVRNEPLELPEAAGSVVSLSEKVYVPIKDHPDFNFVGRILGPRGMTAKQLEQETGCKIMVRGKGSMRDKKKEEQNRGKPNWEHLNDELHVLITVEDTENRGKVKLQRAIEEVQKLLVPIAEGEDELKKRQLMELAIINGTYRDSKEARTAAGVAQQVNQAQLVSPQQMSLQALRAATPLGAPLIISPHQHHRLSNGMNTGGPQLMAAPGAAESLLYASPYGTTDYATYLSLAEYSPDHVGKMSGVRRLAGLRDHPYLSKSDPSASLLH